MKKAVLFLIFNRPDTTKKVFDAIRIAKPPRLYISSDGARSDKIGETESVLKIRDLVLNNIDWKCEVKTLFRNKNLGCRNSVSSAITWFFEQEKDGIILEDDVVPNKSFFYFCEELLNRYANNSKIMHISGHRFAPNFNDDSSYYFAKIQHCWGWASWADRWQYYGSDLKDYDDKNIIKFSENKSVQEYWRVILNQMKNNQIDSWAYQWAFKIIKKDGLCINPSQNLISNIGFSEKATHTTDINSPFNDLLTYELKEIIHPKKIEIDQQAVDYIYQNSYGINFSQYQLDLQASQLDSTKTQLDFTNKELNETKSELDLKNEELNKTKSQLDSTKTQLDSTNEELNTTKIQLDSRIKELNSIYYSRGWKLIIFLKRITYIIPGEKLRKKIISYLFNYSKELFKIILKIKGIIFTLFLKFKNYFIKVRPKKKRIINLNSKKIVYVGHSFHNKTKSTTFLIDYLKEFFEVEVILDESWNGKPLPDLSFINESYLGVIFFQILPPIDIINTINNDNIIFFPMNDQSGRLGLDYWDNYRDLKIINFCKFLHNKLINIGFESIYLQYFPKPEKFIPGIKNKVFFWQRLTHVNINIIAKLFKKNDVNIHLHKTVDPGQEFIQPNKKLEDKFKITYSDWFKTREEMLNVIKESAIYIAPREYEGIGMSFLEAMAMGKAVVAVNNPTMDEYIEHSKNGYLFDLKNPKEIDLSNIKQVQKNSYEYMQKGYQEWENSKHKIIDFIKK